MKKIDFEEMLARFNEIDEIGAKVGFMLTYDLKLLTNSQISKLLNCLNEQENKKFIAEISKRVSQ